MEENDYYSRNRGARKEYQRQYYENNKQRIRLKRRLEELDAPEKYNQEYYQNNKEKILEKRAKLYSKRKVAAKNKS
jgi:hypothetical protein